MATVTLFTGDIEGVSTRVDRTPESHSVFGTISTSDGVDIHVSGWHPDAVRRARELAAAINDVCDRVEREVGAPVEKEGSAGPDPDIGEQAPTTGAAL